MPEMPTAPLHELADVTMGQSPDSNCVNDDERGLPFLQGSAEFGKRSPVARVHCDPPLRLAPTGSALISVRAPVGATNRADRDYCIGRGLAAVQAKVGAADNSFLLRAIEHGLSYLHRRSQGSTFLAISSLDLRSMPVTAPELPVQRRIATILAAVDETIDQTEALIAKMEQARSGLMNDLLSRGVTPDGQTRPRQPEARALYEDSSLGWIPKSWRVVPLGAAVPRATYGISSSLTSGQGVPVLRMNNIRAGEVDLSDLKFSPSPAARALLLRPGDVLFNRTNSIEHVGRTGIWRDGPPEVSFASYLVRLDPDPKLLRPEFLNLWLNWEVTQIRIRRFATPGVHQVNINPTNLRRTPMAIPSSLEEQDAVVDALHSCSNAIRQYADHAAKLRRLSKGLGQDLLSGRVDATPDPSQSHGGVSTSV